ncbi:hypothetical protein [Paenibacillus sedimenti]|uniref:Uncharacterized protein n=1 Tax=Paenibacillus sedimenti TaxID=2770274 RepID=A0A926KV21_9BACL|nr:hypothetical protein [Paenibacillus sedimenti]MBD0382664.1 hypothetical protein [Paenibacillus sedimenti]
MTEDRPSKIWFDTYNNHLQDVFKESERLVARFPAPLNQLGLAYLSKFNATKENSTKNYICYLLPFWMTDLTSLSEESIKKFSLANIFGMLYFFIQDDIMDSPNGEHRDNLPLANLFYLHFFSIYRELFPSDSFAFWKYYEEYVTEWSEAVTNEHNSNYFMNDIIMVAKKASPVKIASTGALLLSNQPHLVKEVSYAIELVLVTLQMLDDWADWEQDNRDGSYNCLLALLHSHLQLPQNTHITDETVRHHLYVHDFLANYAQISLTNHQKLVKLGLHMPQLNAFHDSLVKKLLADADQIEKNRQSLALGGFHYFLSKMVEN